MSRIAEALDALLTWLSTTSFAAYVESVGRSEVDLDEYETMFALAGFPLPTALRELVAERGLIGLPRIRGRFDLPGSEFGLTLEPPDRIFEHLVHLADARAAGVTQAGHWLVFATIGGDLEGAWALDDRFGDRSGASSSEGSRDYGVGWYHQDEVCETPRGEGDPLPGGWIGVEAFFVDLFARARAGFERALEDRQGRSLIEQSIDELVTTGFEHGRADDSWRSLLDDDLEWNRGRAHALRVALARADDLDLVLWILSEIDRDLGEEPRRPVVPGIRSLLDGEVGWPWDYPGPRELLHRLPVGGAWGRRGIVRWALEHAGVASSDEQLERGKALLQGLIVEHEPPVELALQARELAISLAARARRDPGLSALERELAWALVWSLGRPTPAATWEALLRVLSAARQVHAPGRSSLDTIAVYRKLAAIVRGQPQWEPKALRPPPAPPSEPRLAALLGLLEGFEGTQRELLEQLESEWLDDLQDLSIPDRARASHAIRRAINSSKLAARRKVLLAKLGEDA